MTRAATPEPTTGQPDLEPEVEPITYTPPTVTIAGRTYPLRRLGVQDVFAVSRILGRGAALFGAGGTVGPAEILQILLTALAQNEEPVLKLLASLIGVDRRDLDDATRFPMSTMIVVSEALAEHQDLADFSEALGRLAERMPEIVTRSGASSTS